MTESDRPVFFYRMFQVLAYAGAIPFLLNTADILIHPLAESLGGPVAYRLVSGLLIAPVTLLIGILCIRRVPHNLIGWMLITFGYGASVQAARWDLLPPVPTVLIANLFIIFFWDSYILIPLYFPDGRLYPSRLNRSGNRFLSLLLMSMWLATPLLSSTIEWQSGPHPLSVPNPFFVAEYDYSVLTIPLIVLLLVWGMVSLILRYRDGNVVERLQLRWLLAGVIAQFGLLFLSTGLAEALNVDTTLIGSLYSVIIPIAIGIALLRYRLYDIDIIIRKTLVYSLLTGSLAVVYFGSVVLAQQLFRAAAGETPDIAIVISTLLMAALFSPLRRRIQEGIDRRFYRRKYDAEQTLARFNQTLRDEVDIEALKVQLIGVVQETMQPVTIALGIQMGAMKGIGLGNTEST